MTGNIAKGICGSWIGILHGSWSASREVGLKMIVMVAASGKCD
jgi:hypothetical protein